MHAKHSAHPHAGESQPLGYSIQLMNNSATFLMFNSVSEKLLTHALCQLPIAFITLLSPLWEKMKCCCMFEVWSLQNNFVSSGNSYLLFLLAYWNHAILDLIGLCKGACVCFHKAQTHALVKIPFVLCCKCPVEGGKVGKILQKLAWASS